MAVDAPRLKLALFVGLVGAAVRFVFGSSLGRDAEGLARDLGHAVHGRVLARDIKWARTNGPIEDALVGRSVLFLASAGEGGPRDVWRARIRVSPEGHPIAIEAAHNLTQTPLGDDHALVVREDRAAYATRAYGQEQSVSALDLRGEGAQNTAVSLSDRVMAWITNLQQTGSGAGIGRIDLGFDRPADRIGLALGEEKLDVDLGDGPLVRKVTLDLARGEIVAGEGAHAEPARHLPKRLVFWAVDTVRAVSWIGPEPIAWLEEKVFSARDWIRRHVRSSDAEQDQLADAPAPAPARVLDAALASQGDVAWPPPNLPSIWKTPEKGEGVWVARNPSWMRKMPGAPFTENPPPLFYQTFVRPDDQRPDSKVILVAMDMRQLELAMEAGTEDPKPLTGTHGPGRLPRDPQILGRVVAAFNGAFKTEHGNYGMMVSKKVLLPPVPLAATVVTLQDGRTAFGTWGSSDRIGGLEGIADEDILSYRQNLDPLVDDGRVNPTHRGLWGYTLPGQATQTERSGICVTPAGQVLYAWGDDVSATALGRAMQTAGCTYGMHLDMNPHHTGFLFTTIRDLKSHDYDSEALTPLMQMSTDRYLQYSPKDFFYVMVRDPRPSLGGLTWRPDGGAQPAPAWLPAVWSTERGAIAITYLDPSRVRFRVRAGTMEPDAHTGSQPVYDLAEAEASRVLFSVTMGVAEAKNPRALVTGGKQTFAPQGGRSALLSCVDGRLVLGSAMPAVTPETDVAELPLIADQGEVLPSARINGPAKERAALGTTARGEVLVARALEPSDAPLAEALVSAGCTRVLALDRGAHASGTLLRAGTPHPPVVHGSETTLYAIAAPMPPRAFRFRAESTTGVR
jgi:hypothetical protein